MGVVTSTQQPGFSYLQNPLQMHLNLKQLLLVIACMAKFISADEITCAHSFYSVNLESGSRSQTLISPDADLGSSGSKDLTTCTWEFKNVDNQPRQVVVEKTSNYSAKIYRDQCLIPERNSKVLKRQDHEYLKYIRTPETRVMACFLSTYSLNEGDTFKITMEPQKSDVGFVAKISVMDPGYCAARMLAYRGDCHYITSRNLTLQQAWQHIRRSIDSGIQLKSFGSLKEIQHFIKSARTSPKDTYPIPEPLDLTQAVRIGMFYSQGGNILSMTAHGGNCSLKPLLSSEEILSTASLAIQGQCGSLRVNESGSPVIDFVNCNQPMPALISFPDTPSGNRDCLIDCCELIQDWLNSNQWRPDEEILTNSKSIVYIITGALVGLLIIAGLIMVLVYYSCLHNKYRKYSVVQADKENRKETSVVLLRTRGSCLIQSCNV